MFQVMNFYELYRFAPSFSIDPALLKSRYYALSRKYHPDFYQPQPGESEAEALERSSAVNKAYKVFGNADATLEYLLQINGLLPEDEKYALPPTFLAEMMELNEALMEAEMEGDPEAMADCRQQAQEMMRQLDAGIAPIKAAFTDGTDAATRLLPVKEYYYKRKYLQRILQKLTELEHKSR
jgi:molecular chaperone HscB